MVEVYFLLNLCSALPIDYDGGRAGAAPAVCLIFKGVAGTTAACCRLLSPAVYLIFAGRAGLQSRRGREREQAVG